MVSPRTVRARSCVRGELPTGGRVDFSLERAAGQTRDVRTSQPPLAEVLRSECRPQRESSAMQPRLHGTFPQSERARDLGSTSTLDVPQQENFALGGRQPGDRALERSAQLATLGFALRRLPRIGERARLPPRVSVERRRARSTSLAQGAGAARYDERPRRQSALAAKVRQFLEKLEQNVLKHVVGIVGIATKTPPETIDRTGQQLDEARTRGGIAAPGRVDQDPLLSTRRPARGRPRTRSLLR